MPYAKEGEVRAKDAMISKGQYRQLHRVQARVNMLESSWPDAHAMLNDAFANLAMLAEGVEFAQTEAALASAKAEQSAQAEIQLQATVVKHGELCKQFAAQKACVADLKAQVRRLTGPQHECAICFEEVEAHHRFVTPCGFSLDVCAPCFDLCVRALGRCPACNV